MQVQQTRTSTQAINQTQSLAAVQTLLRAGLGCITFLRNLLPDDNFSESYFTSVDESVSSGISLSSPDASQESTNVRRSVNGFKVMTIAKGYTDEADKILDYLENGLFDALEKGYLRSFIFAIYLDNKEPNNIVEAYTFNFKYHTIPGSNATLPTMSLAEGPLTSPYRRKASLEDPVSAAIMKGRTPTIKDVKMSVKTMLKTLIQAMHRMEDLPRRRFANFKVFYTDGTPSEYEPPNFQAGDVDKDRWFFMTRDLDEVPDRCSVGAIHTGHHSVKLSVTSIASYLPSSTVHDEATFCGTTSHVCRSTLALLQEGANHEDQADIRLADAGSSRVSWPAEDLVELGDLDTERYVDSVQEAYSKQPDGYPSDDDALSSVGIKMRFNGKPEYVPKKLHEIVVDEMPTNIDLEETQPLLLTSTKNASKQLSSFSSADVPSLSSVLTAPIGPAPDPNFDLEMLKSINLESFEDGDSEMLDLETQMPLVGERPLAVKPSERSEKKASIIIVERGVRQECGIQDRGLQCDCGISLEDESCFCEGGCSKWFHVWCMGYHTTDDERMPASFICFDCRVRADISWELLKFDLYPRMLASFKDLALFRRAIKVAQTQIKFTSFQFSKAFGGGIALGGEMLKRLGDEGFVLQEKTAPDDMGLSMTSHAKNGKTKKGKGTTRQARPRKNVQKPIYIFNKEIITKPQYLDNFLPDDLDVQGRLLGIPEMTKEMKITKHSAESLCSDINTQTQDESQETPVNIQSAPYKRLIQEVDSDALEIGRKPKKIKMSLAVGVDLAE